MSAIKERLHDTIEALSDKEAEEALRLILSLQRKDEVPLTLLRLAQDPTFRVPLGKVRRFRSIKPIEGSGIPASRLLIEDRR